MGLTININNYERTEGTAGVNAKSKETQNAASNIFAGGLNLTEDSIAQKRKEGQQKALGVVRSAWDTEKQVEAFVQSKKDKYADLVKQKEEAIESLRDINSDEAVLQELYGVQEDSVEQQDLELLKKRQDYQNKVINTPLTEEERNRLEEIDKKPVTEYQQRALELNDRSAVPRKEIRDIDLALEAESAGIRSIEKERLKTHGMVDAQKTAKAITDAANDEIIGALKEEAVDHIDEKLEESEEAAEEQAKIKEERKEKLDELRQKRAMEQAIIEGTKEAAEQAKAENDRNQMPDVALLDTLSLIKENPQAGDVQQKLDEIKHSMKLLEADLKGIEVDKQI